MRACGASTQIIVTLPVKVLHTQGASQHFWQGSTAQMNDKTLSKALAGRDADAGRDFGCREALAGRGVGARSLWRLGPWRLGPWREGVLAPGGFGGWSRSGKGCWCREALAPEKGGDPRSGEALPAPIPLPAKHLSAEPFSRKKEPKKGRQKMPALINTT